jgi:hypothetical protein
MKPIYPRAQIVQWRRRAKKYFSRAARCGDPISEQYFRELAVACGEIIAELRLEPQASARQVIAAVDSFDLFHHPLIKSKPAECEAGNTCAQAADHLALIADRRQLVEFRRSTIVGIEDR